MDRNKQTKKERMAADIVRAAADGALKTDFMRQKDMPENNGSWNRTSTENGKPGSWNRKNQETEGKGSWKNLESDEPTENGKWQHRAETEIDSLNVRTTSEIYSDIEVKADTKSSEEVDASKYSLIPAGHLVDEDDMRHLASLQEEFSQAMDPILRLYNAAMNVTATRLSIIKDEFKFRGKRNPIHHIDTRLKSSDSILHKLEKKGFELSINSMANNIYDIAGVRVICSYIKDVYLVRDRILDQDDLVIMEIKDYIENPKPNGYRSLHMIVRVPVYFMNKKQMVPVEIQIRTEAMDMWASLEHDIKYKSLYQDIGVDFTSELLEASQLIYKAEEKMEYMNDILEE